MDSTQKWMEVGSQVTSYGVDPKGPSNAFGSLAWISPKGRIKKRNKEKYNDNYSNYSSARMFYGNGGDAIIWGSIYKQGSISEINGCWISKYSSSGEPEFRWKKVILKNGGRFMCRSAIIKHTEIWFLAETKLSHNKYKYQIVKYDIQSEEITYSDKFGVIEDKLNLSEVIITDRGGIFYAKLRKSDGSKITNTIYQGDKYVVYYGLLQPQVSEEKTIEQVPGVRLSWHEDVEPKELKGAGLFVLVGEYVFQVSAY